MILAACGDSDPTSLGANAVTLEPTVSVETETEMPAQNQETAEPCLLYTSPSPRDYAASRMPSSA